MIALWIILGILALMLFILILPVNLFIEFKEELFLKVKILKFKIFEIKPQEDKKKETNQEISDKTAEEDIEKEKNNIFKKLKNKYGFCGAVKVIFTFLKDCLTHIKISLRHIKIRKTILNISIAGNDAAQTAIQYGIICSAVYPVLSLLESISNIKYKNINIKSDFESKKSEFSFSALISCKILFLLIGAIKLYKEFKLFKERENL